MYVGKLLHHSVFANWRFKINLYNLDTPQRCGNNHQSQQNAVIKPQKEFAVGACAFKAATQFSPFPQV